MNDVHPSPTDKLAWHEERIDIPLPPAVVYDRLTGAPLEQLLPGTDGIPAVVGTEPLNDLPKSRPGFRHRVLLADGTSAIEEVLENRPDDYFAYKVWGYTHPAARPIEYGKGEFWYLPGPDSGSTTLRWRYSFKLRRDRFPGALGPIGRLLFTKTFLDRGYATFMRASLAAIERYVCAEVTPPATPVHARRP